MFEVVGSKVIVYAGQKSFRINIFLIRIVFR